MHQATAMRLNKLGYGIEGVIQAAVIPIQFEAMNKTSKSLAALGHIVAVVVDLKTEKPEALPVELIEAFGHASL